MLKRGGFSIHGEKRDSGSGPIDLFKDREGTCEVLDAIADPDFLRDAWSGKSRYVSSPHEIYNNVYSDAVIDGYADPELGLDEAQKAAGKAFIDSMEHFDSIGGPELPWQEVIDHPGWIEVREAAASFSLHKGCRWPAALAPPPHVELDGLRLQPSTRARCRRRRRLKTDPSTSLGMTETFVIPSAAPSEGIAHVRCRRHRPN